MSTPGEAALRATAQAWLAEGRPALLVQVLRHRGSVPREAGTRMLVSDSATAGTIGGGHLEWQALAAARALLITHGHAWRTHPPAPLQREVPLGPALGQCCGGSLTLHTEPLSAQALADWPVPQPAFTLQLHGAGHVGRAIARLLAEMDIAVQWVDARLDGFDGMWGAQAPGAHVAQGATGSPRGAPCTSDARKAWPPLIQPVTTDDPAAEVRDAPPGAAYLVLTHRHDLDLAVTAAILKRGDAGFVGLIGSATKRARFEARLRQRGVSDQALASLTCPIGLPGIPGKQPAVIAVSVVAQLLQWAAQTAGKPMAPPTAALRVPGS